MSLVSDHTKLVQQLARLQQSSQQSTPQFDIGFAHKVIFDTELLNPTVVIA